MTYPPIKIHKQLSICLFVEIKVQPRFLIFAVRNNSQHLSFSSLFFYCCVLSAALPLSSPQPSESRLHGSGWTSTTRKGTPTGTLKDTKGSQPISKGHLQQCMQSAVGTNILKSSLNFQNIIQSHKISDLIRTNFSEDFLMCIYTHTKRMTIQTVVILSGHVSLANLSDYFFYLPSKEESKKCVR